MWASQSRAGRAAERKIHIVTEIFVAFTITFDSLKIRSSFCQRRIIYDVYGSIDMQHDLFGSGHDLDLKSNF